MPFFSVNGLALNMSKQTSLLPLRSVGRSNFDKGLHNLITLIKKLHKIMIEMKLLYYIYNIIINNNNMKEGERRSELKM